MIIHGSHRIAVRPFGYADLVTFVVTPDSA